MIVNIKEWRDDPFLQIVYFLRLSKQTLSFLVKKAGGGGAVFSPP